MRSMRRPLLLVAAVVVCVDTMLNAALTPLLGQFAGEFGLSRSTASALVAAYAAGAAAAGAISIAPGDRERLALAALLCAAALILVGAATRRRRRRYADVRACLGRNPCRVAFLEADWAMRNRYHGAPVSREGFAA